MVCHYDSLIVITKLLQLLRELTELATSCRFVKTKILSQAMVDKLSAGGVTFAEANDAAKAVLRLAADPQVTGTCISSISDQHQQQWLPRSSHLL